MVLPRFLAELKRRKVYRAALVYAGVGWVLLEAADVILPRLGLPDWTVNVVLAVVLLGFPLALVFAWIFDFSPQGIVHSQPISPEIHHRFSFISIAEFLLICVLVVTVGYLYVDRISLQKGMVELESAVQEKAGAGQPAVPNSEQYRAIAVLPFADMSEAGDQAWFAEGIAEELLHALASVEELRVMARTSSFAFKDTDKTIAEIAEILGVQAVLEGSVRRSGERVRITAQLVDARIGYHLWSGSYERQLTDIFDLQDELARAIVQALRVELGVDASKLLIAEQTRSLEAYNLFMRGRAFFDWDSPENLHQSIGYFEKAVEADPDYALAWGSLAAARSLTVLWQATEEVSPKTIMAYERALELDPDQSEALAAKALMTLLLEKDWEVAGKLYQRAIISRGNTVAKTGYAIFYLLAIDRIPDAVRLYTEAEKLDPLRAGHKASLAFLLLWSGDVEAAILKAQEALELNRQHFFAMSALAEAYRLAGDCPAATEFLQSLPKALQQQPRIRMLAAICNAAQGDLVKAREIYRDVVEAAPLHSGLTTAAQLALSLGEVDEAIDLMERAVEKKSWQQFYFSVRFRHNDALKDHPRYLALLKRIGLDDGSLAVLHSKMSFD
jgi:TolB-like protein/cytochrome c-type biogenesis protein CcmH/NrfG